MNYQVILEKPVLKFLKKNPEVVERFFHAAQQLEQSGFHAKLDIKALQGSKEKRRLRIGKRRFLFRKQDQLLIIYFYATGSRGDIYS